MKKITALILALLLMASLFTGCSGTKEFTCQDLTITVPSKMKDVSTKSEFSGYTFTLDSKDVAIFGLREKTTDPNGREYDLNEYANLVIEANKNKITGIPVPTPRANHDYVYFTYEYSTEDGLIKYLTGCYKGEDAFWMVQVAAKVTDFELETFLDYLDSVKLG